MTKKTPYLILMLVATVIGSFHFLQNYNNKDEISGAPPFGLPKEDAPETNPFDMYKDWVRPDVPPRVGLQVGHWKNDEIPEELFRLKGNTGASGGGKWEWEVNKSIADIVKENLEEYGVEVDILPTTVPPKYWADVFLAIHADGSTDTRKSGYKFAGPWYDFTGDSEKLVQILNTTYEKETNLEYDPNITRNMRGYYAFSWWRFEHAIHPMTTAAIAETGFLTNYSDQQLLIKNPEIPAEGITEGILSYLQIEGLLN